MEKSSHVIADFIHQWNTPFVEQAIFGTGDAAHIAQYVDAFCESHMGSAIDEFLFYESSQGAVFGLRLQDGRRVVIKAHQPTRSIAFLSAVYHVQHYLVEQHYPCPKPLLGPTPLVHGYATVEELIDEGIYTDAHIPAIRRSMAEKLAQLIELTHDFRNVADFQSTTFTQAFEAGRLWSTPHSKIFDFEATAQEAEWIDEIARKARETLMRATGEFVIGHTDWSVKHFRYVDGKVRVIYDWDSLARDRETIIVAGAARGFTMTWHLSVSLTPTPEEAGAFVHEYEEARGKVFTAEERKTIIAAATYGIAYGARCEHCFNQGKTDFPPGSHLDTLARYGEGCLVL